jgi:hypothetical protein
MDDCGQGIFHNHNEETAMTTTQYGKTRIAFGTAGLIGLMAGMLMLGACALKETTPTDDSAGPVISVKDSSKIDLKFDSDDTTFTDTGVFDLVALRQKMKDKGINSESVEITGLVVSYDDETAAFIKANEGVPFYIRIYIRENDTGATKLALESLVNDDVVRGFKALAFDPTMTFIQLGKHIFGNPEGYPNVLSAIKDVSKEKLTVIAKLTLKDKLKLKGELKLNMIVTVAGKV